MSWFALDNLVSISAEERKDDKGSDSVTRRELLAHIERLYIAKRAAEKRIAELGGMPSSSVSWPSPDLIDTEESLTF